APAHRDRHAQGPRPHRRSRARQVAHGATGRGRHPARAAARTGDRAAGARLGHGPRARQPVSGTAMRWTRIRLIACGVAFGALFIAIGKRAFNLQVGQGERLQVMAEEQYLREIELPPRRGRILDRNGAELASTADVDSIYCQPRQPPAPRDAARRLARVLGLDRADLEKKLGQRRFFAWVKRKVTPDEVVEVKALGLPGLAFTRAPRRFYPTRALAATIMGHAGSEGNGLEGIELALDRQLRGTTTSVQGMRDALGRDIAVEGSVDGPT